MKPSTPKQLTLDKLGRIEWTRDDNGKGVRRSAKLRVLTARQLLDAKLPVRAFLLHPWLREQESALLYAPTGAGKSFFALSLAVAIAGGGRFLNWKCDKPARVLYVDGEMHTGDQQKRLAGIIQGALEIDAADVARNLVFFPRHYQKDCVWFPSVTDPEGVRLFRELLKVGKSDLVIFDNLSTLGDVSDENSASAFAGLTQTLLMLKAQGIATVLVHHAGKAVSQGFRGSSRLAATFEVILKLDVDAVEDWKPQRASEKPKTDIQPARFCTVFEKARSGVAPPQIFAQLDQGDNGALTWTYEIAQSARLETIRTGLAAGQWKYQREIADSLKMSTATISRDIRVAEALKVWPLHWAIRRMKEAREENNDF